MGSFTNLQCYVHCHKQRYLSQKQTPLQWDSLIIKNKYISDPMISTQIRRRNTESNKNITEIVVSSPGFQRRIYRPSEVTTYFRAGWLWVLLMSTILPLWFRYILALQSLFVEQTQRNCVVFENVYPSRSIRFLPRCDVTIWYGISEIVTCLDIFLIEFNTDIVFSVLSKMFE